LIDFGYNVNKISLISDNLKCTKNTQTKKIAYKAAETGQVPTIITSDCLL